MPERLPPLRLALAQLNPRVGDLEGNAAKISEYVERARDAGAELVVFPELVLTGYPPEDLLLKEHFLRATQEALAAVAADVEGIVAVVGYPERTEDVFDSIAVLTIATGVWLVVMGVVGVVQGFVMRNDSKSVREAGDVVRDRFNQAQAKGRAAS